MTKLEVVAALRRGEKVMWGGNVVSAEPLNCEWQEPTIWINLQSGSSYKATGEFKSMRIVEKRLALK